MAGTYRDPIDVQDSYHKVQEALTNEKPVLREVEVTTSASSEYTPTSSQIQLDDTCHRGGWDRADGTHALGMWTCDHLQDIRDYRSRYQVGMGKNIAFASYSIDGSTGRSSMAPSGRHEYPDSALVPSDSPFKTRSPPDSAPKILNELINKLGVTSKSSGVIQFHSERPACANCRGVLQQFGEMFPNIDIMYTDYGGEGPGYPMPEGRTVTH